MKEEKYVQIPNKMFAFATEYYATSDELFVFYHIGRIVQARNPYLVLTSIDMLHTITILDYGNPSRGKSRVKKALHGLQDKGYIKLTFEGSLKNSSLVEITLPSSDDKIYKESVKSGSWTYYGYTEVRDSLLEKAENIEQIKVLIYVEWRQGIKDIDYAVSYTEWEQVLGVSHTTAVKILKECTQKGMIVKKRGQYYLDSNGETRQETNQYMINTAPEKEPDFEKEFNFTVKSLNSRVNTSEERDSNWFKTGNESKLDANDMYIYLTTKCSLFKEHAEKRINGLNNSGDGGQNLVTSLMKKANERLDRETHQIVQAKINDEIAMQNMRDSMERQVVYKPQKDRDMTWLYGDGDVIDLEDEF